MITAGMWFWWLGISAALGGEVAFDSVFEDRTMRVDYYHGGNAKEDWISLDHVYVQGSWAGSRTRLADPFDNGRYQVKVLEPSSGKILYSRGFDSIFSEYKTTQSALQGQWRVFHETALIPCPRQKILLEMSIRGPDQQLKPLWKTEIDPASPSVLRREPPGQVKILWAQKSGDPHKKVDLAILGEGYTPREEKKFQRDVTRFAAILFSQEPYKRLQAQFNVVGVLSPSEESGCDEPRRSIYKRTALGLTFNSLGLDRYVLTEDNRALRDVAGHVPYDALLIMLNHKRYGGGGIYNLFATFPADNERSPYVFLHELGHSFAGLGDEYFTSPVAYESFFDAKVEPSEPNVTALLDPRALKWKELVEGGTPLPTPWTKEGFEAMERDYQKVRARLNDELDEKYKQHAPLAELTRLEAQSEAVTREHAGKLKAYLGQDPNRDKVGAFEGAGYQAKGLYRPMIDCIMFSSGQKPYCQVCEKAIEKTIQRFQEP